MANNHPTPDVDPATLAQIEHFWSAFTKYSTWSVLGVIAIVVLLALFVA